MWRQQCSFNGLGIPCNVKPLYRIFRSYVVNVTTDQNQTTAGAIPYAIINPSVPTETMQYIHQGANYVQLQHIMDTTHSQRATQPPSSSNIANRLLNQRPIVETPPPAFEALVDSNTFPILSSIRPEVNRQAQSANNDPPPPYPGPPPGESSL